MKNGSAERLSPSAVEKKVEEIWREVLGMRDDQAGATFFELDGQSIMAVRIVALVEEELGIWIDVGDLFEDPDLTTFTRDIVARFEDSAKPDR